MSNEQLVTRVIADIESQNWTVRPLTYDERHLIWMAVCSTRAQLEEAAAFLDELAKYLETSPWLVLPEHQTAADCRGWARKLRGEA